MAKILAASWHRGGMKAILPAVERLRQDGNDVRLIAHKYAEAIAQKAGAAYETLEDIGLPDLSNAVLSRFMFDEMPDAVLTGTSAPTDSDADAIDKRLLPVARMFDIPSIAVLDFWGDYTERFSTAGAVNDFFFMPDLIAVMDTYALEAMRSLHFPSKILRITGNPVFDGLADKVKTFTPERKKQIRQELGIVADNMIFYAGNAFMEHQHGYWDLDNIIALGEACATLSASYAQAVVTLHPRQPDNEKREIARYVAGFSGLVTIAEADEHDLALASDVVVTPFSTTGIEALYMERPVFTMQPEAKINRMAFLTDNGIIPLASTVVEAASLVFKILNIPDYKTKLLEASADFRAQNDGKATDRVVELVYSMVR